MIRTPKTCPICLCLYMPSGNFQKRCATCISKNLIDQNPPLCACGCGEHVVGSRHARKKWNTYVFGHAVRVNPPNPNKGKTPWNKGNVTRYEFYCALCGIHFYSKLKDAKFCSKECYAQYFRGKGNPNWKGGVPTTYKVIKRDGRTVHLHRIIMEEKLCRELDRRESVHHIDGNGQNNTIENLYLFHCEACHQHHHRTQVPLAYIYGEVH